MQINENYLFVPLHTCMTYFLSQNTKVDLSNLYFWFHCMESVFDVSPKKVSYGIQVCKDMYFHFWVNYPVNREQMLSSIYPAD